MSGTPDDRSTDAELGRRPVIGALAAGLGLSALGGVVVTAQDDGNETDPNGNVTDGNVTDGNQTDGENGTVDGDAALDPVFGFSGASSDVAPPVEPDHEISLETGERAQPDVGFPEWFFDPVGHYVEPGDTVMFSLASPLHTISAYHPDLGYTQRVPDGVGPISSPVLWSGSYFLYTFEEPGVYDLFCFPHEFAGMVVRIVAGEASGPGAEAVPEPTWSETEPDPENPIPPDWLAATVLRDPAMDPQNIIEAGSVAWADLAPESTEFPPEFLSPPGATQSVIAALSGAHHGVFTEASGCLQVVPTETGLSFDLLIEDIEYVTQAHIHEGDASVGAGPVVAPLVIYNDALDGTGEGELQSATFDSPIVESGVVEDPELAEAILENPSDYYVNVHTTQHPDGEIRGQLRGRPTVEEPPEDGDGAPEDGEAPDDEEMPEEPPGEQPDAPGNETAPDGNVTEPNGNVTEPDGNVTEPDGNVTEPNGNVTDPDGNVTEPPANGTDAPDNDTMPGANDTNTSG